MKVVSVCAGIISIAAAVMLVYLNLIKTDPSKK